jgi:hypothetical protein
MPVTKLNERAGNFAERLLDDVAGIRAYAKGVPA